LVQGARSSLQRAQAVVIAKATPEQVWIRELARRLPFGKVLVAIAKSRGGARSLLTADRGLGHATDDAQRSRSGGADGGGMATCVLPTN